MKNIQVSVRIDCATADSLRVMADEYGVKKSDLMRFCMEKGAHDLNRNVIQHRGEFSLEAIMKAMDLKRVVSSPESYPSI